MEKHPSVSLNHVAGLEILSAELLSIYMFHSTVRRIVALALKVPQGGWGALPDLQRPATLPTLGRPTSPRSPRVCTLRLRGGAAQ